MLKYLLLSSAQAHTMSFNKVEDLNTGLDTYATSVWLGTPPQKVDNVMIDTGSWLPWFKDSALCGSSCDGVPIYDSSQSSTYQNLGT